jgi:diguanylate cyclase (GGDEF)-like protein
MAAAVRLLRVSVPRQYLWPLLSLLGVCFGFIFLLIFLSTRAQDAQQLERERQALGGVFATASAMVQHDLQDYAKWDDAVRHIGSRFDAAWMDDNVVAYLGRTQGYSDIFVLGADDRTLYSFKDRKIAPNTAQLHLGADFVRSIAEVRRLPPEGSPIVSGFTRSGNQVLVYATAAVVPLTGKIAAPRGPTRLLVIARQVDEAFLADLTRELNVHEVRLTLGNRTAGMDAIAIKGRSGERIAWLEWRSHHPGASLRQQLVPAILAVAFVAFVAAGLILRRGSQSIEALRASELLARHLSDHDPLTELPNRRALGERLGELVAARQGLALLFLDLDGFKDANDVYGHSAGDLLLKEAAGRLKAAAGEAFIARAGGDEFAVLLRSPSSGVAAATCEAILEAFSTPFKVGAYSITIGTSIGYFESATSCDSAEELIRKADVAMYAAKDAGRNCAQVYHPSLDEGHERRQRLEQDLKRAVENEEIYVRYQPIVDAQSGEVVAVEALARWSHPVHGDVPPDVFIPIAEISGLINAIGRQVLLNACREMRETGLDLAVNLSPAQFWDGNLYDEVQQVLERTGFPPERLELEITESLLLRRPQVAAAVIDRLRSLGIRMGLDDFGTGFASIAYLQQLTIDRLKIDRSFLAPLESEPDMREVLVSIVGLAKAYHLEVCAEGIETPGQAQLARLAGCGRLQGWLFGRPQAASAFQAVALRA